MEQGRPFTLGDLSPRPGPRWGPSRPCWTHSPGLDRYARQAAEFHVRNARAWASAAAGENLAAQIDPDFTLGPHVQSVAAP